MLVELAVLLSFFNRSCAMLGCMLCPVVMMRDSFHGITWDGMEVYLIVLQSRRNVAVRI